MSPSCFSDPFLPYFLGSTKEGQPQHHTIRTVKLQLLDSTETKGRWVIEGDLASYFETVHHRRLMHSVRKRIRDQRFLSLLWRFIKAGHVDHGLFRAASEGVPQGGVLSPLLSNIMFHEFDTYLEANYLSKKARKDRWAWNVGIQHGRPITIRENRQWKPAVAYCRYADDFVVIVKGNKHHAEAIRPGAPDYSQTGVTGHDAPGFDDPQGAKPRSGAYIDRGTLRQRPCEQDRYGGKAEPVTCWLGQLPLVHGLHRQGVPASGSYRVLEAGALAGP